MKKLISAEDIELAQKEGKNKVYIDTNTIITSLAEDMAEAYEMEIIIKSDRSDGQSNNDMDMEMVYKVFTQLMDKELLSKMMELVRSKPYEFEGEPSGLKLIKGNTIRFERIEGEDQRGQVFHRQLIGSEDKRINNGLINIDSSSHTWNTSTEEVYYIIDGDIKIEINNSTFTAYPGDVIYIPTGSNLTISSLDKARLFYTTY